MVAALGTKVALLAPASSMQIRFTGRDALKHQEIRLNWSSEICHFDHEIQSCSIWCAASPWLRRDFEIMVAIANEVFGDASHWIEERPAFQSQLLAASSEQPHRESMRPLFLGP